MLYDSWNLNAMHNAEIFSVMLLLLVDESWLVLQLLILYRILLLIDAIHFYC